MPSPTPMTTSSSSLPLSSPCECRAFSPSPLAQVIHGSNPLLPQKKKKISVLRRLLKFPLRITPRPCLSAALFRGHVPVSASLSSLSHHRAHDLWHKILAALPLHLTSPRSLTCSRQCSRTATGERCYVLPVLRTALFLPRTGECLFLWPSPLPHVLQKKHRRCRATFPP